MAVGSDFDTALHGLTTTDPVEFERHLENLLASVKGLVRDAVQRTLGSHFHAQTGAVRENIDDLSGDAMLLLTRKLRDLHSAGSSDLIQNFPAYAATVASNVCCVYLRRRYPAWTRLKNQVRYVATHDPELALRLLHSGFSLCVLKEWGDETPVPGSGAMAMPLSGGADAHDLPVRDLIKAIIRNAGRPVDLNELVSTIAQIRGIRDAVPVTEANVLDINDLPDKRVAGGPDHQAFLRQVWTEVRELPVRQRMALLLNLRDERGRGVLALFPITGTASMRQIAEVLGIPAEELAKLWNNLPIEDLQIAERLGITRQQVINLRKAARARLNRRLAGWRS